MPGRSHRGDLEPLSDPEQQLRGALESDLIELVERIGERNVLAHPRELRQAVAYLEASLGQAGLGVERQAYDVGGETCFNLIAEIPGGARAKEIVVVGAHYDSVVGTPGADDNASGTAALLALARTFAGRKPARTLRLVGFVNEEPPYFQTPDMGSWVYARRCKQRQEQVVAMLSLEMLGYYSEAPNSQAYPFPLSLLYPSTANFVGFVADRSSRALVRQVVRSFRSHARFPSEGASLPSALPGVGFSDQWSFWQEGYPALMVTDTSFFRYPHYHTAEDTIDKLDLDRMTRVVAGLEGVVTDLLA